MKKQRNAGKRISYYLPASVAEILSIGDDDSSSGRISHMVVLAHMLINESVPTIVLGEWRAIADAIKGHLPSYEQGPKSVFGGAWHIVHDSWDKLDEKWGVDCKAVAHKLMAMPISQQAAVFEICAKRFLARPDVLNASGRYA